MVNHSSIKYITSLLNSPETITAGDQSSIALFRQTFPYFVPVRYLAAVESNKANSFSDAMLSEMQPYIGDWILFCDFLEAGGRAAKVEAVERVWNKKKAEVAAPKQELQGATDYVASPVAAQKEKQAPGEVAGAPVAAQKEVQKVIIEVLPVQAEIPNKVIAPEADKVVAVETVLTQAHTSGKLQDSVNEENTQMQVKVTPAVANEVTGDNDLEEVMIASAEKIVEADAPSASSDFFEDIADEEVVLNLESPAPDRVQTEEATEPGTTAENDALIFPVYTQDYFLQQGEKISEEIPDEIEELIEKENIDDEDKSLMVVMSFSEWLLHFKNTSQKQQEEKKDQKALKTMWQKEKLAAAMEEENEEIPENVFEMAVNSITKEEDLASEPLANIYIKQGKYDQAIEMFRKLSLRNPQKSAYFARKIEEILKEKSS